MSGQRSLALPPLEQEDPPGIDRVGAEGVRDASGLVPGHPHQIYAARDELIPVLRLDVEKPRHYEHDPPLGYRRSGARCDGQVGYGTRPHPLRAAAFRP